MLPPPPPGAAESIFAASQHGEGDPKKKTRERPRLEMDRWQKIHMEAIGKQ